MSKYTTELRYICETLSGLNDSKGMNSVNAIIEAARPKIFNFSYDLFDPEYKRVLETKILKHFYTREIGAETYGLWKLWLESTMQEIMPYYNRLYKDGMGIINPFNNVNIEEIYDDKGTLSEKMKSHETHDETRNKSADNEMINSGTITDNKNSETMVGKENTDTSVDSGQDIFEKENNSKNVRWDKYSDTPQGTVGNLDNDTYLSNARKITDDATGSTIIDTNVYGKENVRTYEGTEHSETSDVNQRVLDTNQVSTDTSEEKATSERTGDTGKNQDTTDYYIRTKVGRNGVNIAQIIQETSTLLMDVDRMIINNLEPLFMGLWY